MGKVLGLFIWLKARLTEPSTHASLSAVCAALGYQPDFEAMQHYLNLAAIGFGALGFFFKEQAPLTKVE